MILLQWESWKKIKPWFGAWKVNKISSESQSSLFPPQKMIHSCFHSPPSLSSNLPRLLCQVFSFAFSYMTERKPLFPQMSSCHHNLQLYVQNHNMLYIIKLISPLGYSSKHCDCIIAKGFLYLGEKGFICFQNEIKPSFNKVTKNFLLKCRGYQLNLGKSSSKIRLNLCTTYNQHTTGISSVYDQFKVKGIIKKVLCGVTSSLQKNIMILSTLIMIFKIWTQNHNHFSHKLFFRELKSYDFKPQSLIPCMWLSYKWKPNCFIFGCKFHPTLRGGGYFKKPFFSYHAKAKAVKMPLIFAVSQGPGPTKLEKHKQFSGFQAVRSLGWFYLHSIYGFMDSTYPISPPPTRKWGGGALTVHHFRFGMYRAFSSKNLIIPYTVECCRQLYYAFHIEFPCRDLSHYIKRSQQFPAKKSNLCCYSVFYVQILQISDKSPTGDSLLECFLPAACVLSTFLVSSDPSDLIASPHTEISWFTFLDQQGISIPVNIENCFYPPVPTCHYTPPLQSHIYSSCLPITRTKISKTMHGLSDSPTTNPKYFVSFVKNYFSVEISNFHKALIRSHSLNPHPTPIHCDKCNVLRVFQIPKYILTQDLKAFKEGFLFNSWVVELSLEDEAD
ncbi:hypothetical protein VP01_335g3 [Puccinia sorghi]|uniref:Uncharacterized protein n=1 Tax=Puccinia sorghi TaxID=27349 RepID=A0A0L6UX11_9BASI|nr:hypothetical protein VP01_335g3 [Puccinia sorghi]